MPAWRDALPPFMPRPPHRYHGGEDRNEAAGSCQLPSKPHSTGLFAVRLPSHTPIVKQTNPKIRARSDTRPQNLAKAVVMAARRWFASSLRQISRFYLTPNRGHRQQRITPNGVSSLWVTCEISGDNKKSPAEAGQPWMGRGLASTCFCTLGGRGHRRNDKEKPFDNRSPYWLNDSGVP